jgi:hypothetical protein
MDDVFGAILSGRAKVHAVDMSGESSRDNGYAVSIDKQAQAMELAMAGKRYLDGNPFRPGDMVTPRPGFAVKGEGHPHIVLDVLTNVEPRWTDVEDSSTRQGQMLDMRVACFVRNDVMTTFWVEAWQYEAYPA